ncbi:MAG: hypothetical protein NUV81_03420 [bacterium]|nr:hypothetical protein [bacterium]
MAEISSTLYAYERLLDVINESVERTRHLIAKVESDPIARFEKLIQHVNDAVADFLDGEPTPITWGRVSLFLIELSPNHICLAGQGRLMNIFLQKQEDGSYRTFDLLGSLEQPSEVDPKKFFGSLICGDMKPGDVLMLGSTNLERLRKEMEMKTRLTQLPPVTAALEIKNDLESRGIPDDFLAAIISCCALNMPEATREEPDSEDDHSTASIKELRRTERETSEKLAPSLVPSPNTAPKNERRAKPVRSGAGILGIIKKIQSRVLSLRRKDIALLTSLRGMNAGHGSVFTQKRKRLLLIGGAIFIVCTGTFVFWKRHVRIEAQGVAWEASFAQATDHRQRAESDLIYANDARAITHLQDAESILASLTTDTTDHTERLKTLHDEINGLHERLRKVRVAENVVELARLDNVEDGSLQAVALSGDTAYVVDRTLGELIKIDLVNTTQKRIQLPEGANRITTASVGDRSIVFATDSGTLYSVNIQTDTVQKLSFTPPSDQLSDIVVYSGRLYVLDGVGGQIWKSNAITGGFGTGSPYIKASNISLEGAVSVAIDSNVYVLKSDGTVARYLSGGQEGFSISAVDPEFKSASSIWADVDSTKIVITDPDEKRILIFNKDGSLSSQVTSDEFHALRDIAVDETAKRMIVIDGTRLLLVPMP